MRNVVNGALLDIRQGLRMRRLWMALAAEDIGDQHRRTTLGPIWLVLNYLIMIAIFVFLFQRGHGIPHFAAYAGTGLLVWTLISDAISQGTTLFVREEGFIKGTTLPLSVYVMRLIMQSLIRIGYTSMGCLLILFVDGIPFTVDWAWALPGVAIVLLTMPAAIIVFAFLGAYAPDAQFVIGHLMRIGMFVTPIFWLNPGGSGLISAFYHFNPFTHFIDIVRSPILYGAIPLHSFVICIVVCLCLWIAAIPMLGYFHRRIVFVL